MEFYIRYMYKEQPTPHSSTLFLLKNQNVALTKNKVLFSYERAMVACKLAVAEIWVQTPSGANKYEQIYFSISQIFTYFMYCKSLEV